MANKPPAQLHGDNHAAQNKTNTQLRQLREFGKNPLIPEKKGNDFYYNAASNSLELKSKPSPLRPKDLTTGAKYIPWYDRMGKDSPIKKPYIYDTKEGIDFFTKTLKEESTEKLTPEKNAEIDKLNTDMKKSVLKNHLGKIKPWDQDDPQTYPSLNPELRGRMLEASKLEADLEPTEQRRKKFEQAKENPKPVVFNDPTPFYDFNNSSRRLAELEHFNKKMTQLKIDERNFNKAMQPRYDPDIDRGLGSLLATKGGK
jgi:hypothetical protein|tara:strand:+ start:956 stop:1726 length:771 start_codon:yes stop_codon:yes gene_type:complete